MAFSTYFRHQIYPEWTAEYVSYQAILKGLEFSIDWDDNDEQDFRTAIAIEFKKVDIFITKKEKDIQASISYFNRFDSNDTALFVTLLKLKKYIRSNYQALEDLIYQHNTRGEDLMPFFIDLNKKHRLDTQRLYPLLLQLDNDGGEKLNAKYWVDQSCVSEVKSILLFHLSTTRTATINQTYFDNPKFKHYLSNVQWDQDAEMILCQKANVNNAVDIINTTLNSDGETLTTISEEKLDQYLQSRDFIEPKLQIKLDQSVFSKENLAISLENNITFTKTEDDSITFPYAVLEITMMEPILDSGWLLDLLNTNLVYPVPCYSNVLQGVASFYHTKLAILPEWWSPSIGTPNELFRSTTMIMDMNKRKILTNLNQIGHLEQQLTKQLKKEEDKYLDDVDWEMNRPSTSSTTVETVTNNKSSIYNDEYEVQTIEDRNSSAALVEPKESGESTAYVRSKLSSSSLKRKISFIDYYDKEKKRLHFVNNPNYTIYIEDSEDEEKELKKQKKEKKKEKKYKKFLKMTESTIEPKLFFANERTFIHWLQFAAQILSAALVLLNFGDLISIISGGTFFGISLVLSLYAFGRYRYRAYQMSNTPHIRYDDIYGPIGLCVLVLGATLLNFVLRWEHPPSSDTYLGIDNETQQQQ
ncbi:hypothetical protein K501DRAFT_304805 [Backusella circina FSU 941]|nr:hypothetical protein K501DRAFT_304805 [Backusella circina FSU 941]